MNDLVNESCKKKGLMVCGYKFQATFTFFLTCATFLSYMIPLLAALHYSEQLYYTNAWDEESYLSFQHSKYLKGSPGYFSLNLVHFLHHIGVSGAIQNVLFDMILIPATAFFTYRCFRSLNVNRLYSTSGTTITLFGSVLFNYANPIVHIVSPLPRVISLIMPGWEAYPSILRTPNPQISYFIIAATVYFFLKYKRIWILACPLPLLYFYVALPYTFILCFLLFIRQYKHYFGAGSELFSTIIAGFTTYFLASFVYYVLFRIFYAKKVNHFGAHFIHTHVPNMSLAGIFCIMLLIFVLLINRRYISPVKNNLLHPLLVLLITIISLSNLQVLNGFVLILKNIHDYSISVLACLFLAICIIMLSKNSKTKWLAATFNIVFLIIVFVFTNQSQGFSYKQLKYKIWIGRQFTSDEYKRIIKDPLHFVILDRDIRGKFAYSCPKCLCPPAAYQYSFMPMDLELLDAAVFAAQQGLSPYSEDYHTFSQQAGQIRKRIYGHKNQKALPNIDYRPESFFIVKPITNPVIKFPD